MMPADAIELTKRSESWLRRHQCMWCEQDLWRALRHGCPALFEKCDPTKKDFSPSGKHKP